MYCEEGCPKEALDKLDNNIQLAITTDSDEPKKETSTNIQPIASETAVKTKNIAADITKNSCIKKTSNSTNITDSTNITKNTGDTARSNSNVTTEIETDISHVWDGTRSDALPVKQDSEVGNVLESLDAFQVKQDSDIMGNVLESPDVLPVKQDSEIVGNVLESPDALPVKQNSKIVCNVLE